MSLIHLHVLPQGAGAWRDLTVSAPGAGPDKHVLVVPGVDVLAHELDPPGRTARQTSAAALQLLAERLAAPIDECMAAAAPGAGPRFVLAASRRRVDEWIEAAHARGLQPDLVVPDYLLLQPPPTGVRMARLEDGDVVMRGAGLACACEASLAGMLAGDAPIEWVDFDRAAAETAKSGELERCADLRPAAPSEATPAGAGLRRVLSAGLAAAALFAAAPWVLAIRADSAARSLRQEARETAQSALPQAARIVDPRAQLKETLARYEGGRDQIRSAHALIAGLAGAPQVQIHRLETSLTDVRAQLSAAQVEDLAPLREHLAGFGLTLVETPGLQSEGRVAFDVQLVAAP
jgi:general secretion pathway protein L